MSIAESLSDQPRPHPDTSGDVSSKMSVAYEHREATGSDGVPALPPGQDELPHTDGMPMESQRHRTQMELLINGLLPWLEQRREETGDGAYIGGDMFVYFSTEQVRTNDFRGPDVFVVLGTEPGERKSWVVWEEGKGPDVIIELLSENTRTIDKTVKKAIYQDKLRVPEYFWFDPFAPEDLAGFVLCNGAYKAIEFDEAGRLPSGRLGGIRLTRWAGWFRGIDTTWLRWCTSDGQLLLTSEEIAIARAEQATARAEQATARAEQATARAEKLASQLRALGLDPDALD